MSTGKKESSAEKRTQLSFACDVSLRDAFVASCKDQDTSAARELRAYMKRYISKNGQKAMF
jgi:hypothetical protein